MSWYNDNKEKWKEIIEAVANETKRDNLMIEKDIIQSMFLYAISKENSHLIFKGGTSLSKVYGIIDRFSEDLDISMDIDPTASERRNIKDLFITIGDKLELKLENKDSIKSRYDYNKYEFTYKSLFSNIRQEILVETNFYQVVYPIRRQKVTSIIKTFCDNNKKKLPIVCDALSFEIFVQSVERTFIDKVFAVCDYYIENMQKRDSRHLYDICKMYKHVIFDNEFKELIKKVRVDRMKSKNNPSADIKYNINNLLKEIIDKRFFEKDYKELTSKLLYEDINYDFAVKNGIAKVIKNNMFV